MEGWEVPHLIPLLASLADLLRRLKQWHNAYGNDFGRDSGNWFTAFLAEEARGLAVTVEDVAGWQPAAKVRGKRGKKKAVEPAATETAL